MHDNLTCVRISECGIEALEELSSVVELQPPHPYYVSCFGSIIHAKWILTAAHCVDGFSPTGIVSISHGFSAAVSNIIIHENYADPIIFSNDIALLELDTEIEFTDVISPLCYPSTQAAEGDIVTVTGFGKYHL